MNATTKPAATILDLDAMMDESLDMIEDLPDYMNPPNGLYRLRCTEVKTETYESKAKNGKPASKGSRIRMTTAVVATVELQDGQHPVADGTLFSETFQGTEDGLKFFKQRAIKMMNVGDVKGVPLRDIFAELTNLEYDAKITTKVTPGDTPGAVYENLQVRIVPPQA